MVFLPSVTEGCQLPASSAFSTAFTIRQMNELESMEWCGAEWGRLRRPGRRSNALTEPGRRTTQGVPTPLCPCLYATCETNETSETSETSETNSKQNSFKKPTRVSGVGTMRSGD